MKNILLLVLLSFLITGCNDDLKKEIDLLKQSNSTITKENEALKEEINELKNGASRLLAIGKKQFEDKKYLDSISTLKSLIDKHPSSNEANESKEIIIQVENEIKKIKEAEELKIKQEKERTEKALEKLSKRRDDLEKTTKYVPFVLDDSQDTNVHLFIFKADNSKPFINMKFLYSSSKWLFIDSFFIVVDDIKYEFNKTKFQRDHDSKIWEWYIKRAEEKDIEMIEKIIQSKKSTIRFYGQQYYYDHVITNKEKESMQMVLDAFKAFKKQG